MATARASARQDNTMLNWLGWGKPDHPLADMDEAKAQLAVLSRRDSVHVLEQVAKWLESVSATREFKPQHRLELIDLLDKTALTHRRKLTHEYVATQRLHKSEADRVWNVSLRFWNVLGAAYLQCIGQFKTETSGATVIRASLPLVAARALRSAAQQIQWTLLRYGQIETRLWRELGSTYLIAERQGVAGERVEIYPGQDRRSSAQEELLRALMLFACAPGNLLPLKLHIAERIVAHFGSHFSLQTKPVAEHGFVFDIASAMPPARMQTATARISMGRYFGAGDAEQGVRDLTHKIRQMDGVPSDVDLGGNFDQKTVLSVLEHLARAWDSTPPARRAERSEGSSRVTIVPGLPNILRCLELVGNGISLDPESFTEQETWTTFNRSDVGYGALVPKVRDSFDYDPLTGSRAGTGDWLRIGCLLALCEEGTSNWVLGVVRRITDDGPEQRRVGIELLSGMATVVKLASATGPRAAEPERRRSAVLLSGGNADEVLVLMRAGHFSARQSLEMQLAGKRLVLQPAELIEAGEDFDCARYTVTPASEV
jgi:hypothetical protein